MRSRTLSLVRGRGVEAVLTRNMSRSGEPTSLGEYEAAGGYSSLRLALRRYTPDEVVQLVTRAELRGRGGAGFPTGMKWASLPPIERSARPRILMVNCDEMEPGTFKDRLLVQGDPHQVIEGALIAAYACQIEIGYIYVRGEYVEPARALERALGEARIAGYLGDNVLGSGWNVDMHVHGSAGRYMCGEETGLVNAIEGRRANPRTKPPYVVTSGAWGKPTVVNNVETLACLPHIVQRGPEWFCGLGKGKDRGIKIYGVSGRVKRPGCYELEMGTTLRELVEEHAGGMLDGFRFKAALPGGASTMFLDESEMDVPLDFSSLKDVGGFFGTGCAIVADDTTCIVGMVRNLQQFYARESCGWCTPCRDGLPWLRDILTDIEEGRGRFEDIDLLLEQTHFIFPNTFCALGAGACVSITSSIRKFREEYREHARLGRCPLPKRYNTNEPQVEMGEAKEEAM